MITPSAAWLATYDNLFTKGHPTNGYKDFLCDEYEANKIEWFQNSIIPGLLQTEAYARAVTALQWPTVATQEEIDALVAIRLKSQWEVLDHLPKPELHFILDEAALHRQIGGKGILYEQLTHLLKITDIEDVTLQILPLSEGSELYPYGILCFTIFRFKDKHKKPTLYCDYPLHFTKRMEGLSNLFLYERAFTRLCTIADKPEQSRNRIQRAIKMLDESGEIPAPKKWQ